MENKKINYRVTIGYRSIISVDIKADSEDSAKESAIALFKDKELSKWYKTNNITVEDDSYGAYGIINDDMTWNTI